MVEPVGLEKGGWWGVRWVEVHGGGCSQRRRRQRLFSEVMKMEDVPGSP
jgi:hypothetical protein